MRSIIIVGAGLAGVESARALRSAGFDGRITMLGAESHSPYDRPPLSKEFLRDAGTAAELALSLSKCDVELRLGSPAAALRASERSVIIGSHERLAADGIILATGSRARTLPEGASPEFGVHTLRTLDDAYALRAELIPGRHLVILGGGFIGAEVAAAARSLGVEVTIIEPQAQILTGLGPIASGFMADIHRHHGVRLRLHTSAVALHRRQQVTEVELTDGTSVEADLVLVGIGNRPNTEWLEGSGLHLDDGVVCDQYGRTNIVHIVGVGDCSAWRSSDHTFVRRQHWNAALQQAGVGAKALLGTLVESRPRDLDSVWTDQYDVRVQTVGTCAEAPGDAPVLIYDSGSEGSFTVVSRDQYGRVRGLTSINDARGFARWRRKLGTEVSPEVENVGSPGRDPVHP